MTGENSKMMGSIAPTALRNQRLGSKNNGRTLTGHRSVGKSIIKTRTTSLLTPRQRTATSTTKMKKKYAAAPMKTTMRSWFEEGEEIDEEERLMTQLSDEGEKMAATDSNGSNNQSMTTKGTALGEDGKEEDEK